MTDMAQSYCNCSDVKSISVIQVLRYLPAATSGAARLAGGVSRL